MSQRDLSYLHDILNSLHQTFFGNVLNFLKELLLDTSSTI